MVPVDKDGCHNKYTTEGRLAWNSNWCHPYGCAAGRPILFGHHTWDPLISSPVVSQDRPHRNMCNCGNHNMHLCMNQLPMSVYVSYKMCVCVYVCLHVCLYVPWHTTTTTTNQPTSHPQVHRQQYHSMGLDATKINICSLMILYVHIYKPCIYTWYIYIYWLIVIVILCHHPKINEYLRRSLKPAPRWPWSKWGWPWWILGSIDDMTLTLKTKSG